MKKFLVMMLMGLLLAGNVSIEAKTTKKTKTTHKKTTSTLPVKKGEIKKYGDYLTTQFFSAKKGKDSKVELEYPIDGNPQLVSAMRQFIKDRLKSDYTGSLESPEGLIRSVLKDKRDVQYEGIGESLTSEIEVEYATPSIITLKDEGYWYGGGVHGDVWEIGATFLVKDGTVLTTDMFPPIYVMRDTILQGIADKSGVSMAEVYDGLYNASEIDYPGVVLIDEDGINFIYQLYEIAPFSEGIIKCVIAPTPDLVNSLTPEGQKFFK